MKKSRFSETQIVSILSEADAGLTVQEVCRKHGISPATYYKWKSKYGGLEASGVCVWMATAGITSGSGECTRSWD